MQVIVIASRKGGAGKTTLAANLAVEATRDGIRPVATIDADPMQGLTGWFDERKANEPLCVGPDALAKAGIGRTLATLEQSGVALVIIDTPPAATADVAELIGVANLVLAPVIPSPNDLRAIGETLDLIEQQDKPLLFVINNASTNGKLTNQALTLLSQHGTVAAVDSKPVIIRTRQDFRSSMTDGRTVSELKAPSKSAEEIADLWMAVKARLEKEEARRGRRSAAA
ncbi:MAG TPA: ParA family protein [Acetobacteraceae bacterium]|nr:ParA family protein [Acetobacteraceae bacterium]